MKQYAITVLLLASLTVPALATNLGMRDATDTAPNYSYDAKDHWAVDDTVGNCAVIELETESLQYQRPEDCR